MNNNTLIWNNSPLSGLCDRLIDFSLIATYAKLNNSDFSSKWKPLYSNYGDGKSYWLSKEDDDTSLDNLKLFIDCNFVDLLIGREDNKSFRIKSCDMQMTLTGRHFLPINYIKDYADEGFDFINVPSDTKFIFTVCEDFYWFKDYSSDWNGVKYKIANHRIYKL